MKKRLAPILAILGIVLIAAVLAVGAIAYLDTGPVALEPGAVVAVDLDMAMAPMTTEASALLPVNAMVPGNSPLNLEVLEAYVATISALGLALIGYIFWVKSPSRRSRFHRVLFTALRFPRDCIQPS